jgi:hypothetical protein
MFFSGSRYITTGTYSVLLPNAKKVNVAKLPLPNQKPILGFHRRLEEQRLDLIANRYLKDTTAFWQLCDANNAIIPDALESRDLIGIPSQP